MDGAKIFFSHMVKARIFFFAKTRTRIFFSKKTQAPPWESNGRSLMNGQMSHLYFGYCYWDGDCILCMKGVVDSGRVVVVGDCRLTGGGLLRWQGESVSSACILEEKRRILFM